MGKVGAVTGALNEPGTTVSLEGNKTKHLVGMESLI